MHDDDFDFDSLYCGGWEAHAPPDDADDDAVELDENGIPLND